MPKLVSYLDASAPQIICTNENTSTVGTTIAVLKFALQNTDWQIADLGNNQVVISLADSLNELLMTDHRLSSEFFYEFNEGGDSYLRGFNFHSELFPRIKATGEVWRDTRWPGISANQTFRWSKCALAVNNSWESNNIGSTFSLPPTPWWIVVGRRFFWFILKPIANTPQSNSDTNGDRLAFYGFGEIADIRFSTNESASFLICEEMTRLWPPNQVAQISFLNERGTRIVGPSQMFAFSFWRPTLHMVYGIDGDSSVDNDGDMDHLGNENRPPKVSWMPIICRRYNSSGSTSISISDEGHFGFLPGLRVATSRVERINDVKDARGAYNWPQDGEIIWMPEGGYAVAFQNYRRNINGPALAFTLEEDW